MTHFGIICPAETGHLNTLLPLGRELQRRGHRVTLIGILDAKSKTLAAGLEFWAIAESESPLGTMSQAFEKLGELNGLAALRYTINLFTDAAAQLLRDAPAAIKQGGVEALLVDQTLSVGGTIAEYMGIPFINVCSALVLNSEADIPPFFTSWNYNPVWWARLRNLAGYSLIGRIAKPIIKVVSEYRQEWNLPLHSNGNDPFSELATVSQQPAELEFPRKTLPQSFHFTGPYHDSTGREPVPFPYEKLTGKPLIYASMGTLQNRQQNVFYTIAEACAGLDAQLVISLGGAANPDSITGLPGSPLVVGYAPQLELLQKAALTITHAGLNTTLESLTNAVPMVAIPVANDQPGVAARIAWAGAGEVIPFARLNVAKLRGAVQRVLQEDSYKQNALRLQKAIAKAGGVSRAADIIEQAISTGKPVLSGQ